MESLLRLSGLLSEDDNGKTDLGTLEKRLADRTNALNVARNANSNQFPGPSATQQAPTSHNTTPRMDSQSSPRTAGTSPESQRESETEVEALSDMMCSLVTNNCGETRYIGMVLYVSTSWLSVLIRGGRFFVWVFDFLTKRYSMGQREDRGHIFPGYDLLGICG